MALESDEWVIERDPYWHTGDQPLGRGNSEVWEVTNSDHNVCARKEIEVKDATGDKIKQIRKEIYITRTLKHRHLVEFCEAYYIKADQKFYLLLRPVAEMSLTGFFELLDQKQGLEPEQLKAYRRTMCSWPPCLFRALEYLHRERVRHKDIKPNNILINGEQVYLTDFGISRDIRNVTTSKTSGPAGAKTERYMAPEVGDGEPRGRVADVWSLGCCVLEICTLASGENSIEGINQHLLGKVRVGTRAPFFCDYPYKIFDWIMLLLESPGQDEGIRQDIQKMLQLAFLMLDPTPEKRVTATQLVDLLDNPGYFRSVVERSCQDCRNEISISPPEPHFVFREGEGGSVYIPKRWDLSAETENLWEVVKERWLIV
ncbi:hypothetical protein M434DRAFT_160867 [Hypoxylon sp. CO27-5]|nr:hypothetical protein M434DRAFT_160867 [Hypoxylon sp. CO27-5]